MKPNIRNLISGLSFGVALFALVLFYLSGHNRFDYADALYLPVLFRDVFAYSGSLRDWNLTPAPYFFPDYVLFLPAYWLGADIYQQIIIYSLIQCIAVYGLIYALVRQVGLINAFQVAGLITICLIWLAVQVNQPFIFILLSAHHYGAFLAAIGLVYFYLFFDHQSKSTASTVQLIAICVIAFLGSLSDNLFLAQALAPLAMTCLTVYVLEHGLRVWKMPFSFLWPLAFGVIGSMSYVWLISHPTRYSNVIGFDQVSKNIHDLGLMTIQLIGKSVVLNGFFLAYIGLIIYLAYLHYKNRRVAWISQKLQFVTFFSLWSLVISIVSMCFIRHLPVGERYLIAAFSWPVIVCCLVGFSYLGKRFQIGAGALSLLLSIWLLWGAVGEARHLGVHWNNYSSEQACIDDALEPEALKYGVAQYWDAKPLQAFSRLSLSIGQYFEDMSEQRWITAGRYFKDRYDFAILSEDAQSPNRISKEKLVQLNGLPKKEQVCGKYTVMIYGSGQLVMK